MYVGKEITDAIWKVLKNVQEKISRSRDEFKFVTLTFVNFLNFDRPALAMMEDAEKKNLITPGKVSWIESCHVTNFARLFTYRLMLIHVCVNWWCRQFW